MRTVSRGQSEVVGSLLLVGIVVLTLTVVSVVIFNASDTEDRQLTDIGVAVTTDAVTISHTGGEPIAAADLDVVISFEGNPSDTMRPIRASGHPFRRATGGESIPVSRTVLRIEDHTRR